MLLISRTSFYSRKQLFWSLNFVFKSVHLKTKVFNNSYLSSKFKIDKQFKSVYNSGAKIILIIRENELKTKTITVKIIDVDNNENNVSQFFFSENELIKTVQLFDLLK